MTVHPLPDPMCGLVKTGPTGIRWVCISPPHGPGDPRPPGADPHYWNRESHYFVRLERLEARLEAGDR